MERRIFQASAVTGRQVSDDLAFVMPPSYALNSSLSKSAGDSFKRR
jgi:hypothetical protein